MTSDTGIDPEMPAVTVSAGFVWPRLNTPAPANGAARDRDEPLDQQWARRLDPLSVRAAWCVGEARRLAGIIGYSERPNLDGVCLATGMGAQQTRVRYASRLVSHGLCGTNPIDFPDSIDGAPAAHVALKWHLQGPSFTFLGPDSPHSALVIAARQIMLGTADRMHVVIGDVFEPSMRPASTSTGGGQPSPRMPEDRVLALVLKRCGGHSQTDRRVLLVGFTQGASHRTASASAASPDEQDPAMGEGVTVSIIDAWLGLTALVGPTTIACQYAATLEGWDCCPLTNPLWPRLAFVRAKER